MAIDIVARALAVSGKQNLENYYTKTESDAKYSQATNIENGADGVLIQTTDTNHSFKVMTDGRAKVQSAPKDNDDVVRKLELNGKLTAPTTPTAESAVTMLADGTVGTKPLSEFKEKIYDEDNNKQYTYQLKIKDGFPVLTMVEAEATI